MKCDVVLQGWQSTHKTPITLIPLTVVAVGDPTYVNLWRNPPKTNKTGDYEYILGGICAKHR